jgi:NADPH:quinone reductase-like Zn-dependent oxidoreductase
MKAIAFDEFGGPDVLSLRELPDPLVAPDGVLVQVRAAGVNPVDWKIRQGHLRGAFPHHLPVISGWDVAGVVSQVGPAVTEFAPGDEVIGYVREDHVQRGTYAELVSSGQRMFAAKPRSVDFATSAALPLAGLTALQSLRAVGVGPGDRVLVNAASGGVGHLAVQIALALGAEQVVGTASETNHEYLRSLGATPVSYGDGLPDRVAAVVSGDGRVDAALDFAGGSALRDAASLVREARRHVSIVEASTVREQGGRYVFVRPDAQELEYLSRLVDDGTLEVEVAERLPLAEAAKAHEQSESGHVLGKIVLTV